MTPAPRTPTRWYRVARWLAAAALVVPAVAALTAAPAAALPAGWAQVSAGDAHTCAVGQDKTLWCWGENNRGQLGVGTQVDSAVPVKVPGSWRSVSAGWRHTCAVSNAGNRYCWGYNGASNLGLGDQVDRLTPQRVLGEPTWSSVSVGNALGCGVRTDGRGYCWGQGAPGGPAALPALAGPQAWRSLSAQSDNDHVCGVTTAGVRFCWGVNAQGQLGLGDTVSRSAPTRVIGEGSWASVAAGGYHTCGIRSTGVLQCWGEEPAFGTLRPVTVSPLVTWASVSSGQGGYCAISAASNLYCAAAHGQLALTAAQMASVDLATSGEGDHVCAVSIAARLYCWGANDSGQLGLGFAGGRVLVPTLVS
ncbi:hypothetical protein [Kineosporia sp. A_224]|uniref:RCC1 domain-containing protein n=1 Tax=Kineosporia sp. A_224 TaxID=1962180 RepID=UPI000B4B08EC|nr:hypothetical protein [Kineosporia sp. A_224]